MVKFSGDPCEFFKFKTRFHQMVESQNLSDAQKMSHLLQFLECNTRKAVACLLPSFKDLVEFVEKRADVVNDAIFG